VSRRDVHWRRWVATVVGVLVAIKSAAFLVSRLFRFSKHEVEARGGDVAFVLGLAERRRTSH
jgi:hypothetical protein